MKPPFTWDFPASHVTDDTGGYPQNVQLDPGLWQERRLGGGNGGSVFPISHFFRVGKLSQLGGSS